MLKQLFFFITKTRPAAGGFAVNITFELQNTSLLNTSPNLDIFAFVQKPSPSDEFLVTCQHQATAFDLPFQDIFAPTKNSSFELSDDVIARDLGSPQSKIVATPMALDLRI